MKKNIIFNLFFIITLLSVSLITNANNQSNVTIDIKDSPAKFGKAPQLSVSNDSLLLSWTELNSDESLAQLKFATYKNNQWSAPITVAQGSNWFVNYADYAKVTPLSSLHLIASWLEFDTNSNFYYHFKISQSFDGGQSWSLPISPISQSHDQGEHGFLSIINFNNKALLAWISTVGDGFEIQSSTLDKKNQFSDIITIDDSSCSCCHTDMINHNNQALLVYRDRTINEIRDIALTSLQNKTWSKPKIINHDNWQINGCPVNGPVLSSNASGYAVAWFNAANNRPQLQIMAKNNSLKTIIHNLDNDEPLGYTDATAIDDERVVISWLSIQDDNVLLKLRIFNINTLLLEKKINSLVTDMSGFPSITYFERKIYITYSTPSGQIKLLEISA